MEQAFRQMEGPPSRPASLTEELVRLAIHGTLHVLGHEHPEGEDRYTCEMFILQERLVQALLA